jgi:hypothetical protein
VHRVHPKWNVKDVHLHDNVWPHTTWHTCEAIAKIEWTVLLYTVHSPDLALFDSLVWPCKGCTLWTPFCRLQQIETKRSRCALKSRQWVLQHWYTPSYSVLANVCWKWQTFWKSSLIIAKDVWIICVNYIVIAVTFSEKKLEALLSYCPSFNILNGVQLSRFLSVRRFITIPSLLAVIPYQFLLASSKM